LTTNVQGNTVTITGAITDYTAGGSNFQFTVQSIIHPNSTKPTSSFVISTLRGTDIIDTVTSGATYQATAGTLSSVSVTSSPTSAGSIASLTISMTIANGISTGCYLSVLFPSEFSVVDGGATCSGITSNTLQTGTCTITSRLLTVSNILKSNVAAGGIITFKVDNVPLPINTRPTLSQFTIATNYLGYIVDSNTSIRFTATSGALSVGNNLLAVSNPITG
jgi:hypothetical protein